MATVFLARLPGVAGFSRLVAIKRLHPHLARETEFVDMFLDEARLAARIHHPNVVPIQEVGQSEGGYYLVMEYVEGDTLARIIARAAQAGQAVPHGVVVRIVLDVLAGLHAAHELRDDLGEPLEIVHRDVSPQNVLVGIDGVGRVVDFGVAKAASRLTITRTGQLKGKLGYMAPEQARGVALDRRADLFACGIVLWEALAVKRLFKGEGEAETLSRVLYDPILPPSHFREGIPAALEAVCMRALSREPEGRHPTARAMAEDLERAAQSLACIGSVRDVAACIEEALGADLSQQREAVRAWLARSEPNASSRPAPVSLPRPPESQTKIEGAGRSSISPDSSASLARARQGSLPPEKLSSVASAAVFSDQPSAAASPPRGARRGLYAAGLALLCLGGVIGFGALGINAARRRPAPVPAVAASVVVPVTVKAETPAAAETSLAPAPTAPAVVSATPPAPSVPVAASSSPKHPAPPAPLQGHSTKPPPPKATKPVPSVPDDLSNNPYR